MERLTVEDLQRIRRGFLRWVAEQSRIAGGDPTNYHLRTFVDVIDALRKLAPLIKDAEDFPSWFEYGDQEHRDAA